MRTLPFITIGMLAGLVLAAPCDAATLRGVEIHVANDTITLADIFADTGSAGTAEVAKAPPAGKTIMLDSSALFGLAVTNHLDWRPRGMNDKVIVFRDGDGSVAATAIAPGQPAVVAAFDSNAVIAPLKPALTAQGAGEKVTVLLDGGNQQQLLAGITADTGLAVDTLQFTAATHRFAATLVDIASGKRYAVAGKAIAMVEVPVPVRRIEEGETVNADMLTTALRRADELRSDDATKADVLLGKVTKRQLEASQPIQARFVAPPSIVHKGDRVTMIVRNGGMVLTAEGRALNDAGLNETVHLTNAATNKPLDGVATGPDMAEIKSDSTLVAAVAALPSILPTPSVTR